LFKEPANVELLRSAIAQIKAKKSFEILATLPQPDHIHFVWQLPPNDSDYSQRISRLKVLFTLAFKASYPSSSEVSASRA
jgi:putative transposase